MGEKRSWGDFFSRACGTGSGRLAIVHAEGWIKVVRLGLGKFSFPHAEPKVQIYEYHA